MNVGVTLEIDQRLHSKAHLVHSIDNSCKNFFIDKSCGCGIDNLFIGLILVSPENPLHPARPLKFRKREVVNVGKAFRKEFTNCVSYDVKPDYGFVLIHDGEALLQFLVDELCESTAVLETHCKKYPAFDVAAFRADFRYLLQGSTVTVQ
jgi:hypothetical protein